MTHVERVVVSAVTCDVCVESLTGACAGWDGSNANVDFINWCVTERYDAMMRVMCDV